MQTKFFEIRDEGTMIPALAIKCNGNDSWLMKRVGYGVDNNYVLLIQLTSNRVEYDPYNWPSIRTMRQAHLHIAKNFDTLENNAVIDVQYILGETKNIKASEKELYA